MTPTPQIRAVCKIAAREYGTLRDMSAAHKWHFAKPIGNGDTWAVRDVNIYSEKEITDWSLHCLTCAVTDYGTLFAFVDAHEAKETTT